MLTGNARFADIPEYAHSWYELSAWQVQSVLGLTALMILYHGLMRHSSLEALVNRMPWVLRAVIMAAIVITLAMVPGDDRAFIYFQF